MSAVQTRQQIKNHFTGAEVQVACGLVGEQYRRAAYQRARQDHALLLSSGQFPGTMRGSAAKPDFVQSCQGLHGRLALNFTPNQQRHHHILQRRKLRQEIVDLPDESNLPITKISLCGVCEP